MREAHPVERAVGIEYYVSESGGVGGRLRDRPGDFRVREREAFDVDLRGVDADPGSYPHLVRHAGTNDSRHRRHCVVEKQIGCDGKSFDSTTT